VFIFVVRIRAWIFIGLWFGYQLVEGHYGLTAAHGHDGGTAFFAHIGGFVFGVIAAVVLVRAGKQQDASAARGRLRLAT
jgi:rhomboid family protein